MHDKIVALGLDAETAEKVENVLKEIIKDNYVPLARFNEVNEAKKKLDETITQRDNQLAELSKASGMTDDLKRQIDALQADNAKAKQEYNTEIKRLKTDTYINGILAENGVLDAKFIPAIKAYLPNVDIDSEDSKIVFTSKIAEVKTFLPTMFKNEDPQIIQKGLHIDTSDKSQTKTLDPKGSWESYLDAYQQN